MSEIADRILARQGFYPDDVGPDVTAWRKRVEDMVLQGLTHMSTGTWASGSEKLTQEERAKAWIEFETAPRSEPTTCIDKL